ncbi:MAG: hypothetical protein R3234_12865 [Thermoanaerobaculia bacterium]|nr:hypothetical protein [Thermoanaerobaculia bacterium]
MTGGVAEEGTLRRLEGIAALYGLSGTVWMALERGWRSAAALTLLTGVSIVSFRTLEGVVRRLEGESTGTMAKGGGSRFLLRWVLLLAALGSAFILGSHDLLALLIGITVIPMALITEAGLRILGAGDPPVRED